MCLEYFIGYLTINGRGYRTFLFFHSNSRFFRLELVSAASPFSPVIHVFLVRRHSRRPFCVRWQHRVSDSRDFPRFVFVGSMWRDHRQSVGCLSLCCAFFFFFLQKSASPYWNAPPPLPILCVSIFVASIILEFRVSFRVLSIVLSLNRFTASIIVFKSVVLQKVSLVADWSCPVCFRWFTFVLFCDLRSPSHL